MYDACRSATSQQGAEMTTKSGIFLSVTVSLLLTAVSSAQELIQAPIFRDGDWWIVTVEGSIEGALWRSTCFERHGRYLVKIINGDPKVFIGENLETEIVCPEIYARLLGSRKGVRNHFSSSALLRMKARHLQFDTLATVTDGQKRLEPTVLRKGKAFEKKEKREWNATRHNLVFENPVTVRG